MEFDDLELDGQESTASAISRLGAVVFVVCTVTVGAVVLMVGLDRSPAAASEDPCSVEVLNTNARVRHCLSDLPCNACGVVERVRVIPASQPAHPVSTVAGGGTEGIAVLFGALTGKFEVTPVRVYQIEVRMKDGSQRAFLLGYEPIWQQGDRVKVQAGRVGPIT
jgi:hypothetical protein